MRLFLKHACDPVCVRRAVKVALVIGTIHAVLNHFDEIIANSMKHAFHDRRTGEITFSMTQAGSTLSIEVSDDGIGIPEDIDPAESTTLGLQLVVMLVQQIKGTMSIFREKGSRFVIKCPFRSP